MKKQRTWMEENDKGIRVRSIGFGRVSQLSNGGGFLYDHYEKSKEAEYQKGYKAGQQSSKKGQ